MAAKAADAQTVTDPTGWTAVIHFYDGPYYNGPLGITTIPRPEQTFATPDAACAAAANFANGLSSIKYEQRNLSQDFEEDIR